MSTGVVLSPALPDDLELRKLATSLTTQAIADRFGVTQQAVSFRLTRMGANKIGHNTPVLKSMPWDLSGHPDKRRLMNQRTFAGLRYFVVKRLGDPISERAERDLRYFTEHVKNGEVVHLDPVKGFIYVPRLPSDGDLVVRWPEGREPTAHQRTLFQVSHAEQDASEG